MGGVLGRMLGAPADDAKQDGDESRSGRGRSGDRTADSATRRRSRSPDPGMRLRWKAFHVTDYLLPREAERQIAGSIATAFRSAGLLFAYNMDGDQSATTTVSIRDRVGVYKTKDQMHSEMCAIAATPGLNTLSGGRVAARISAAEFTTSQPHCGYCTFFLIKLGLPLSKPTVGLFNLARNCDYPLPDELFADEDFISNVCGFGDPSIRQCAGSLVDMLNTLYVNTGSAAWADFKTRPNVLKNFWRQIFTCMNKVLPTLE